MAGQLVRFEVQVYSKENVPSGEPAGGRPMPMSQLVERAGELEPHRAGRIVCYCHHGVRSLQVVHWLRQQGFAHAQSMAGGIDVWSQQVDAAMPRYELGFEGLSPLEAAKDDPV